MDSEQKTSTGWCSLCDSAPVPVISLQNKEWDADATFCQKCARRLTEAARFMREQRMKADGTWPEPFRA